MKCKLIKLLFVSDVFVSLSEFKINKCLGGGWIELGDSGSGLHYLRRFNREDACIRIIVACDKKNPIIAIVVIFGYYITIYGLVFPLRGQRSLIRIRTT